MSESKKKNEQAGGQTAMLLVHSKIEYIFFTIFIQESLCLTYHIIFFTKNYLYFFEF